jgi:hypothetical protein
MCAGFPPALRSKHEPPADNDTPRRHTHGLTYRQ